MFQMVQSQLSDLELIVKTTLAEHILMEFAFFLVKIGLFLCTLWCKYKVSILGHKWDGMAINIFHHMPMV